MKLKVVFLAAALVSVLSIPALNAQSTPVTEPPTPAPPSNQLPNGKQIQQRKENQQDRIANGVASGQLTAGETKRIESQEATVNKEERRMAGADNGKLTNADRARLTRQQNSLSREIYRDKHNAATQNFGRSEVGRRQENQQDRIAQGIRSGQLTAGETAKLEAGQQRLNRGVNRLRQENGGGLTQGERARVNQVQNNMSKHIYKDKHNAAHQRP